MITLTAPNGTESRLDGSEVVRIRRATHGDDSSGEAKTRIDWVELMLVREEPSVVAAAVRTELDSLAELTLPDGSPLWFNAKKADGPVRLVPSQKTDGVRSAIIVGGDRQYLANTPEEVAAAINAAGGKALPVPVE